MIEPEVRDLTPTPAAAVRVQARTSDLVGLFDEHLPNIAHRLADIGIQPAGPPYARYHDYGPEKVDVEIGIPVASPVPNVPALAEAVPRGDGRLRAARRTDGDHRAPRLVRRVGRRLR